MLDDWLLSNYPTDRTAFNGGRHSWSQHSHVRHPPKLIESCYVRIQLYHLSW